MRDIIITPYDEWSDQYGFDLWGEYGEEHEADLDLGRYRDRIVSLVYYGDECDDEENCPETHDFVIEGWARVDVIRRVLLPKDWRTGQYEWPGVRKEA